MGLQDRDYVRERNRRNENVESFSRHRQNRQQQQQTDNEQNRNEQSNPNRFPAITIRHIYPPVLVLIVLIMLFALLDYFNIPKNENMALGSLKCWLKRKQKEQSQSEIKKNTLPTEKINQMPLNNTSKPKWQKITVCDTDNNCKTRYTNIF